MSMMGTLAKVAIGIAVAKGASTLMKNVGGAQAPSSGRGETYGRAQSPGGDTGASRGGLEDMMGDLLGGGRQTGGLRQQGGGLGDLLESLQGGPSDTVVPDRPAQGGGLDSLLEGLTGGQGGGGGGLGDLLGGLLGGAASGGKSGGSFGELLNQSMQRRGEPEVQPTQAQDAAAALMLKATIQAAKSDGKIDEAERRKLLDSLGDVSAEERDFVNREMQAPVDAAGLARQVPKGLENQVYVMSVMAIDLDNQREAQYLHELATGLGIDQRVVNHIHEDMGLPLLYR